MSNEWVWGYFVFRFSVLGLIFGTISSFAVMAPANRPIDVQQYSLRLKFDPRTDPKTYSAELTAKVKFTGATDTLIFDREGLDIDSVTLLPGKLAPASTDLTNAKLVAIKFPKPVAANAIQSVRIQYRGKIGEAHKGFFRVTDPDDAARGPLFFTHFEPMGARSFFPCNDEPYDKAAFEFSVTIPAQFDVISNGKKLADLKKKEGKELWKEVRWSQTEPISTYSSSLAIGAFASISDQPKKPEMTVWVGAKKKEKARFALDVTRQSMKFFEDYTGVKYPWAKYATVGLPTFLWGGMENTSSTHMNEERTLLNDPGSAFEKRGVISLAAHELAHQWFGNLVTMKWWNDVWLNESFASHLSTLASTYVLDNQSPSIALTTYTWDAYFREENGPRSHAIVQKEIESPDDAFDATNYTKGENVLRMLSFYMGDEKFRRALKIYLSNNSFKNATYLDFFKAAELACGENLTQFRDTWLLQRGYPVLTYGGTWDSKTKSYQLKIAQKANHDGDNALFHFRLPVTFHRRSEPAYEKQLVTSISQASHTVKMDLPAEPEWVTVNPGSVVLARIEMEKPEETIIAAQAFKDPNEIARLWAITKLAKGLMEGEKISRFAEKTIAIALKSDESPYVRSAILKNLQRMKTRFLPEAIGEVVLEMSKIALSQERDRSTASSGFSTMGGDELRAEFLGTLGKVNSPEVIPLLASTLNDASLPLDDLGKASFAVATQGDGKSVETLRAALQKHSGRGYRYQYLVQYSFGALESTAAASEIRELSKTAGSDLMGRIGGAVKNNQTLKNSREWSEFLSDFILTEGKFGDEVKARLLSTVDEVKNTHVDKLLANILEKSTSGRLRGLAEKMKRT